MNSVASAATRFNAAWLSAVLVDRLVDGSDPGPGDRSFARPGLRGSVHNNPLLSARNTGSSSASNQGLRSSHPLLRHEGCGDAGSIAAEDLNASNDE
jgi:hypothetical protein